MQTMLKFIFTRIINKVFMYKNQTFWSNDDFKTNRLYWKDNQKEDSIPIRIKNLKLLNNIFKKHDIFYFLEGNTLNYIYRFGELDINDHDDDIGVFRKSRNKILLLEKDLNKLGFQIIRSNKYMISVCRDYRYIDICVFKNSLFKIGYGNKIFPKKFYKSFKKINFEGVHFNIPSSSRDLLEIRYGHK